MEKKHNSKQLLFKMTLTAVFLALALALKALSTFYIPLFGANGIRVGLSGIFTTLPALLFGPLYGGFASAASDMLGTFINPSGGAWIPWFTLVAFAGGFVKGLLWRIVRKTDKKLFKGFCALSLCFVLFCGIFSHSMLYKDGVMHSFVATTDSMGSQSDLYERYYNGDLSLLGKVIYKRTLANKNVFTTKDSESGESMKYLELFTKKKDGVVYVALTPSTAKIKDTTYRELYAQKYGSADVYLIAEYDKDAKTLDFLPLAEARGLSQLFERAVNEYFGSNATLSDLAMHEDSLSTVSDTYRKNAASYANALTVCPELAALLGVLIILVDLFIRHRIKAKGKTPSEHTLSIFFAVALSGLLVTTLNTFILRALYTNYSDLAFFVFWIPRVTEELIVCTVQTYIIALLYGIFRKSVPERLYGES